MAKIQSAKKSSKKSSSNLKQVYAQFRQDLEEIFQAAFEAGNFSAALKAKELQIKDKMNGEEGISYFLEGFLELNDEEIEVLLQEIKSQLNVKE